MDGKSTYSQSEAAPQAGAQAQHAREDYGIPFSAEYADYARGNYGSQAAGDHGKRAHAPSTRKRVAIGVAAAAALLLFAAAAYALWFMHSLDQALAPKEEDASAIEAALASSTLDEPFYLLALGSDSREGSIMENENESYQNGQERSDVILLVRVDPDARQLTMVTVPRDTPYTTADGRTIKINEVYNEGGVAASVKAVSELTGADISRYVNVRISEMESIVDSLGGIEVYVDRKLTVKDTLTGEKITLSKGLQTLDGRQAQAFVRSRHAYADSGSQDKSRQGNVRTFVQAVIKKVLDRPVTELPDTVLNLAQYVSTNLTSADLMTLAVKFGGGDMTIYSCSGPTDGDIMEQYDGKWMCYPNPEGWAELMRQVDAGVKPGEIDYAATAITG